MMPSRWERHYIRGDIRHSRSFLPPPATKTTAKYDHAKTSGTRPVGLHDLRLGFGFSLGFGHTVMAGGCNMHCAVIVVLCASMRVAIGLV